MIKLFGYLCTSFCVSLYSLMYTLFYSQPTYPIPQSADCEVIEEMSLWSVCVCVCVLHQTQSLCLPEIENLIAQLSDSLSCLCGPNTEVEQIWWDVQNQKPAFVRFPFFLGYSHHNMPVILLFSSFFFRSNYLLFSLLCLDVLFCYNVYFNVRDLFHYVESTDV